VVPPPATASEKRFSPEKKILGGAGLNVLEREVRKAFLVRGFLSK